MFNIRQKIRSILGAALLPVLTLICPAYAQSQVQILEIQLPNISSTAAELTWKTAVPAASRVDYGTTPGFYTKRTAVLNSDGNTAHRVILSDLLPGTTYYYRISAEAGSNSGISAEASFTAAAANQFFAAANGGSSASGTISELPCAAVRVEPRSAPATRFGCAAEPMPRRRGRKTRCSIRCRGAGISTLPIR
jgi:hypothetical protein